MKIIKCNFDEQTGAGFSENSRMAAQFFAMKGSEATSGIRCKLGLSS